MPAVVEPGGFAVKDVAFVASTALGQANGCPSITVSTFTLVIAIYSSLALFFV